MEIKEEGKGGGRKARKRTVREAAHPPSFLCALSAPNIRNEVLRTQQAGVNVGSVIDRPDPHVYP